MLSPNSSLIDLTSKNIKELDQIFQLAQQLKSRQIPTVSRGEFGILAFFEASTRTRLSFEAAMAKVGLISLHFDGGMKTSLEKGESVYDSLLNMAAMNPKLMVIRCGTEIDLRQFAKQVEFPVINAGWGITDHPTQALLDILTLKQKWPSLEGKKLLIVGDVKHSRVAGSHIQLAKKYGLQISQVGPTLFMADGLPIAETLEEGLQWADAVMALRFQFERHEPELQFDVQSYRRLYGLSTEKLQKLKSDGWILHPGPINHGIELETEVLSDSRSLVMSQVSHGVLVREAIIRLAVGEL